MQTRLRNLNKYLEAYADNNEKVKKAFQILYAKNSERLPE